MFPSFPVEASGGNGEEKGLMGFLDVSKGIEAELDLFCCQNDDLWSHFPCTCYSFCSCFLSDVVYVVNFCCCRSSGIGKQHTSVSPVALCQTN